MLEEYKRPESPQRKSQTYFFEYLKNDKSPSEHRNSKKSGNNIFEMDEEDTYGRMLKKDLTSNHSKKDGSYYSKRSVADSVIIGDDASMLEDNLENALKYIQTVIIACNAQCLVSFGFPEIGDLANVSILNKEQEVGKTLNTVHAILRQRQKDLDFRLACNEKVHPGIFDYSDKED